MENIKELIKILDSKNKNVLKNFKFNFSNSFLLEEIERLMLLLEEEPNLIIYVDFENKYN